MRVIRVRAWAMRALWTWLALLCALVALLSLTEPPDVMPARSPRRHLPAAYWRHRAYNPRSYVRSGCISPPSGPQELQQVAAFWQRVTSGDPRVLVYAAYWDDRVSAGPVVRVLVYKEPSSGAVKLRCLFWYYNIGDPVLAKALHPKQNLTEQHQVVTCRPPLTPPRDALAAISVVPVNFQCGVTRNLLAIQNLPANMPEPPGPESDPRSEGARVGVCIVWWRTGDAAVRLAEWLMLLRYFGVHRAHDNVLRVVGYFTWNHLDQLVVEVIPYASPPLSTPTSATAQDRDVNSKAREAHGDFDEYSDDYKNVNVSDSVPELKPDIQKDDLLPYNECLYRALGERLTWLALLDLDEMILPVRDGTWDRLAMKESKAAKSYTNELADILDFQRWWFPEMLQVNLTSPPPLDPIQLTTNKPYTGPGILWSRAPHAVPPGRIFDYKWSGPTARADSTVTGKLIRPASVTSVRSRDFACLAVACRPRYVDAEVARVHLYTMLCGGASRGVCRALRRVAVSTHSDALWKWKRAQQETTLVLRRLRLRRHEHSDHDDE
ncbi:hypothetical protein O0L34_g15785 [Tuta absoluta]|nr:hypothetical protein O0L34_g15785 [Tuta absoluta]